MQRARRHQRAQAAHQLGPVAEQVEQHQRHQYRMARHGHRQAAANARGIQQPARPVLRVGAEGPGDLLFQRGGVAGQVNAELRQHGGRSAMQLMQQVRDLVAQQRNQLRQDGRQQQQRRHHHQQGAEFHHHGRRGPRQAQALQAPHQWFQHIGQHPGRGKRRQDRRKLPQPESDKQTQADPQGSLQAGRCDSAQGNTIRRGRPRKRGLASHPGGRGTRRQSANSRRRARRPYWPSNTSRRKASSCAV